MKVLVIEDNAELSNLVKKSLENNKFIVDTALNGNDGKYLISLNSYDAILIDLNLPDMDGIDILKYIRNSEITTAVLIITARDELADRINGLDYGADDYITKPFDFNELIARIRANIRRTNGRINNEINIGNLLINQGTRKVFYKNDEIILSQKEFDIIEYIGQKSPNVVFTSELIEHVYDDSIDPFSSVVRVHITNLRKKMSIAKNEIELKTIKGKGYCICSKKI